MRSLLFALVIGMLGVSQVYAANESSLPTFGDWAKKCETAQVKEKGKEEPTEKEICYVFQNVSNKDSGQMIMQVRVGFAPDKADPVLIVTLPLGALLPPGAGFLVEGGEPVKLQFLACGREGCTTVGQPIDAKLVEAMKKGEKAAVRVALLNQQVLTLPVSLKGFTRAYNAIQPK
jgi:invasion protein IalB